MWVGQYNAILFLVLVASAGIAYLAGDFTIAAGGFFLVLMLRLGVGVLNTLSKAFRGKPLIYMVRIEHGKEGSKAS
ncbi:MAG: hypothetical protein ACM33T_08090 [Solirubrobacterales bacterium]